MFDLLKTPCEQAMNFSLMFAVNKANSTLFEFTMKTCVVKEIGFEI